MSQDIQVVFHNAELALASYADLIINSPTTATSNEAELKDAGMSDKQVKENNRGQTPIITLTEENKKSWSVPYFLYYFSFMPPALLTSVKPRYTL